MIQEARRLEVGQIVATPAAMEMLKNLKVSPHELINRHARCDWGDLSEDDKIANDEALKTGGRILSSYNVGQTVWVITEADRSVTTILLPEDY